MGEWTFVNAAAAGDVVVVDEDDAVAGYGAAVGSGLELVVVLDCSGYLNSFVE